MRGVHRPTNDPEGNSRRGRRRLCSGHLPRAPPSSTQDFLRKPPFSFSRFGQIRPNRNRISRMTSTNPITPLGAYPQERLWGQVGSTPTRNRISTMSRIVPSVMLFLPLQSVGQTPPAVWLPASFTAPLASIGGSPAIRHSHGTGSFQGWAETLSLRPTQNIGRVGGGVWVVPNIARPFSSSARLRNEVKGKAERLRAR